MQEVRPIGGIASAGGGRVLGDLRLRPHHHQALKCPRCDSLNTKFCYYNNYNLSQPRHFCKNCRRYWTKGGVLRNVPVGGGCRKSKRSKPKPSSTSSSPSAGRKTPNSLSSSDRSIVTSVGGGMLRILESENFENNVALEPLMESNHHNHQIGDQLLFSSEIGGFANLMSNSADPLGLVGTAETPAAFSEFLQAQSAAQPEWEISDPGGGDDKKMESSILDPTVSIDDLMQSRGSNGGLAALDWPAATETGAAGLFDLLPSSGVDHHQAYWSHTTSSNTHIRCQWSDNANSDLPLFFP